jgi:hypothetical protein
MTTLAISHSSFFLMDLVIPAMHSISLAFADITLSHFVIDPVILILQTLIYFSPAWMIFGKALLRHGNICDSQECNKKCGE